MVGLYRTLSLKESKMGEHTYKIMTASDVYDALSKEIYSVLDNVKHPTIYRRDGLRMEIWTTEGSPTYSSPNVPPNWSAIVHNMQLLTVVCPVEVWRKAIQREDGATFVVELSLGRGEAEYVY
nr:MAG TPA: hypothetical protein [Caudoviricetes sp.]